MLQAGAAPSESKQFDVTTNPVSKASFIPLDIEGPEPVSSKPSADLVLNFYDNMLLFCGIAAAAVVGAYARVGVSYYRIWHTETNYCVMYTQVTGCIIMGWLVRQKDTMFGANQSQFRRILYLILTSGLCGSITTFSTWQMECNKSLFIQRDLSWGNVIGSYNGGRFLEWIMCMWVGVALPQMALHLGGFIAELGYPQNEMSPKLIPCVDVVKVKSAISFQLSGDSGVFALFVVSTILSIALPTAVYPTWIHLMYTSVFGVCGAYLRYLLSHFNKRIKDFPIGTFACNIGGTWLLAIFTCISKFGVDYYDIPTQAVLYGLSYGFCGCLTTVSTLVNEIDKLPKKQSYLYTIATCIVAQFGILLFYDVYAWTTIPESSLMPPPVNFCVGQQFLCEGLMDNLVGCPTTDRDIVICRDDNDYTTYVGKCDCGAYSLGRTSSVLIDAQMKANVTNAMVAIWPRDAHAVKDPTVSFDACLTYENMCDHLLNRMGCPGNLRSISGCDRKGILYFVGTCMCGNWGGGDISLRIFELITDVSVWRRYDLQAFAGYPTLEHVQYDEVYEDVCLKMLDQIQCPRHMRTIRGNEITNDYTTWIGQCICNIDGGITQYSGDGETPLIIGHAYDMSFRIAEDIYDNLVRPNAYQLMHRPNISEPIYEMCRSTYNLCAFFLQKIGCPKHLRINQPCIIDNTALAEFPYGRLELTASYSGQQNCSCGAFKTVTDRAPEIIQDSLLFKNVNTKFLYIPPPQAAYTLVMQSNPFKQLSQPSRTIPLS